MSKKIQSLALAGLLLLSTAAPALAAVDDGLVLEYHAAKLCRADREENAAFWTEPDEPNVQYVEASLVPQLYPDDGWAFDPDTDTLTAGDGGFYVFDTAANTITMVPSPPTNLIWEAHVPLVHPVGYDNDLQGTVIHLNRSGYHMLRWEGKLLLPLPVVAVLFVEVRYDNLFTNGENLYFSYMVETQALIDAHAEDFEKVWNRCYSADDPADLARIQANYRELCLRLDIGYGLPAPWADQGFDAYLTENFPQIKDLLLGGSGYDYNYTRGLDYLANYAVADGGHTALASFPFLLQRMDKETRDELRAAFDNSAYPFDNGYSRSMELRQYFEHFSGLREESLGEGIDETLRFAGDTAVLTFDRFVSNAAWKDWELGGALPEDGGTITFFYDSFQEIAAHPEVKNVVIDLTCNSGGLADAVMDIMGYLQNGVSTATLRSGNTGSTHTEQYKIDTNLDGVVDERDSFEGRYHFYIMTSECSFSCANFLPALAKEQGAATIIGHHSAGGSCPVVSVRDLFGTMFCYSGDWSLYAHDEAGELKTVDGGVEPDLWLPESVFYDGEALSSVIGGYENGCVREFADVPIGTWYSNAVQWAYADGIAMGQTDTVFGVGDNCTEGQMLTFLWRGEGAPGEDAYEWAVEERITGAGFDPEDPLTRAEAVAYLYRYMMLDGKDGDKLETAETFSDVPADAEYYDAVSWAVSHGITNGTGGGAFSPDNAVSREQAVTLLFRCLVHPL